MTARWVIHSQAEFEARHALTSYRGAAEEPHSHQWQVAIRVGVDYLNDEGFALDFHEMHALLEQVIAPLRHSDLNDHPLLGQPTPSAERLAEFLADELAPAVDATGGRLLTISVWEGPDNRVDLCLYD
jgi:6-pyruvoyltetrahydropterin/6-carboxytetrahydropterin synthase